MRITIVAVGKLKPGAEAELMRRYVERATEQGRPLGIAVAQREIGEGREPRPADRLAREATDLSAVLPPGGTVVVLDEQGRSRSSGEFAGWLGGLRENGAKELAFVVGGPDGLDPSIKARADLTLSFGAMTLPHQLVRALVAEQIYRAITIISGHPYHRG